MSAVRCDNGKLLPALHKLLQYNTASTNSIAFHPTSTKFATTGDKKIIIWTNFTKVSQIIHYEFVAHDAIINQLEYSKDGEIVASCSKDTKVRFWQSNLNGDYHEINASVNTISFAPNNLHLATGSCDTTVKIWDLQKSKPIQAYNDHHEGVNCVKISQNNDYIASCGDDNTVHVWDKKSRQKIHSFFTPNRQPSHIAIHPNNQLIAVAMKSGSVRVYDIPNRKLQQHYTVRAPHETTCVDWHPNGKYILCCGKDGTGQIIDGLAGHIIYTVVGEGYGFTTCKFSADGKYFVVAGDGSKLYLWRTNLEDAH